VATQSELERIVSVGRAAYPEITLPTDRLLPLIRQRVDNEDPSTLAGDEIFLACACATSDANAIAAFERRYSGAIGPALARMSLSRDEIRDIEQTLRVRLFVAEAGDVPRVVAYAGQGQLGALVRVAAVRAALNVLRETGRMERDDDGLEAVPVSTDDPELTRLKAQWIAQARANLTRSVQRLLVERLGVRQSEIDDLLPLVESQLELSLERLLT
jgi:hypothetical protein